MQQIHNEVQPHSGLILYYQRYDSSNFASALQLRTLCGINLATVTVSSVDIVYWAAYSTILVICFQPHAGIYADAEYSRTRSCNGELLPMSLVTICS